MQSAARAALALGLCLSGAAAAQLRGHPIEKVIVLLEGLSEKVKKEGQTEEVTYAKFEKWCKDSEKTLSTAIADGKETEEVLSDKVESYKSTISGLKDQINETMEELAEHKKDATEADKVRKETKKAYDKADKDLADTIKAVEQAITALSDAEKSTSGTALFQERLRGLLQMPLVLGQLGTMRQRDLDILATAGLADPAKKRDVLAKGDYKAHQKKYSFKSGNVVDLLKELKLQFEDDRVAGTEDETNSANAYDLAKQARDNAIKVAEAAKTEKEGLLGDAESAKTEAEGNLKTTRDDLSADEKSLKSTKKSCGVKRTEWAERSETRAKEQEAIAAAIKIMAKVTGVRTKAPENPTIPTSPASAPTFLQEAGPEASGPTAAAVRLLREEARRSRSASFARFASQIAGRPFDEVNNMIQKMIFRLLAEQKDEDDHKNWCDGELEKTKSSKADKEAKLDSLDKKLKDNKATVDQVVLDITKAEETVTTLTDHMAEATEAREAGKKENKEAIRDARNAQEAISKAETVLLDFYKDSGKVTLVQRRGPVKLAKEPSTWGASYTGVADPTKQPDGIIAILKQISADFAKMEAETLAQEEMDRKAYQEEMETSKVEQARRVKEIEVKTQEKQRLLKKAAAHAQSKKHTGEELESVKKYITDLQPACVEGDSTYKDRKAARTAEVESLKKAQAILRDWKDKKKAAAFLAPARAPRRL